MLRVAAGTEQKPSEGTIDHLIADTRWVSNPAYARPPRPDRPLRPQPEPIADQPATVRPASRARKHLGAMESKVWCRSAPCVRWTKRPRGGTIGREAASYRAYASVIAQPSGLRCRGA